MRVKRVDEVEAKVLRELDGVEVAANTNSDNQWRPDLPIEPPDCAQDSAWLQDPVDSVTVEEAPTSFSPFSLINCTLLSHFSSNDFIAVAFPDLARDLDTLI